MHYPSPLEPLPGSSSQSADGIPPAQSGTPAALRWPKLPTRPKANVSVRPEGIKNATIERRPNARRQLERPHFIVLDKRNSTRRCGSWRLKKTLFVEAFARMKEAAVAQRFFVSRQIELLQRVASAGVPPLGHLSVSAVRTSLPPHLQGYVPTLLLGSA